jgi:hypothetical protein
MKNQVHQLIMSMLVLFALFTVGCSRAPSEQVVRDALEKKMKDESAGNLSLGMFEKTNGMPGSDSEYTMEFRARFSLSFGGLSHAYWAIMPGGFGPLEFRLYKNQPMTFHREIKGVVEIEGKARLQKTENGWRVTDFSSSKITDL